MPLLGSLAGSTFWGVSRASPEQIVGQSEFTVPGTYTWVAPAKVTSVSVVAVGGGGGGNSNWAAVSGSGGGLGWKNNITVVPGQSYTVVVGAGGAYGASSNATAGGNSYFISLATVSGYGGGNATSGSSTSGPNQHPSGYGGGYIGDGGGYGGYSGSQSGGGGAGGYTGAGGNQGANGTGGGGGGGSGYSSTYGGAAGGGVGIWGQGSNGLASPTPGWGATGGSYGGNGNYGEAAAYPSGWGSSGLIKGGGYGGGGGGAGTSWGGGAGGSGAVRIIWGKNRTFPATNTDNIWISTSDSAWSKVSLMLKMNGTPGAQVFTDSSTSNISVTAIGTAQTSNSNKKFGETSLRLASNSEYLQFSNATTNFGIDSFTVEFWLYYDSTQQAASYGTFFDNGGQGCFLSFGTAKTHLIFYSVNANTNLGDTTGFPHGMTSGNWYHLAFVKNLTTCTIFVNGVSIGSKTNVWGNLNPASGSVARIGQYTASATYTPGGFIDEFRITKGLARYIGNFTPPSWEFPIV